MAKRKSFIKKIFGKRFTTADFFLILITIGFPTYFYFNAQIGYIFINKGVNAVIKQFGGYIWFGIIGLYIVKYFKNQVKN